MGPELAPVSDIYTVRVEQFVRAGEIAIPFGCMSESSIMET